MAKKEKSTLETSLQRLTATQQLFDSALKIDNLVERYEALVIAEEQAKALEALPAHTTSYKLADRAVYAGMGTMLTTCIAGICTALFPPLAPIFGAFAGPVFFTGIAAFTSGAYGSIDQMHKVPKKFRPYAEARQALIEAIAETKKPLLETQFLELSQLNGFNALLKKDGSVQKAFAAATLQKTLDAPEPARLPAADKYKHGFQL